MAKRSLSATIVITSKNRDDDLRTALASCMRQIPIPEVVVIDDGSTDGTSEMVRREFSAVRYTRHGESTGYIVARNLAATLATGDVIVSIDDDAEFSSPHCVRQTLADFDGDRIGAVAIPYSDVNKDPAEHQRSPDPSQTFITDRFIGTAHAVRRDVFLELGGYRELFFHQGEEGDYCARMMDAGYFVKLGNADQIHHFESPKRDFRRMDLFGRRNDVLFAWLNVPTLFLPVHLAGILFNGMRFGFRVGRPARMAYGLALGVASSFRYWAARAPVSKQCYRLLRRIRKNGPQPLDQAVDSLT
jgi:glycosyltransferase involved in cell wall biosynthesis